MLDDFLRDDGQPQFQIFVFGERCAEIEVLNVSSGESCVAGGDNGIEKCLDCCQVSGGCTLVACKVDKIAAHREARAMSFRFVVLDVAY